MKRLLLCALIFAMLLTLTACGEKNSIGDKMDGITIPTTTPEATDGLSALRADMKPPIIAVADFGFPELSEEFGIMDYLLDEYPKWMDKNAFIRDIPEERTILTCGFDAWAQLVCIVPKDPASTVSINAVHFTDTEPYTTEEVIYRSESGDPILLLAEISEDIAFSVVIVDSEGRGVCWQPYWGNCDPVPEDGYYGALAMDFTPQSEKTDYDHAVDNGWRQPELAQLMNTNWLSAGIYAMDLMDDSVPDDNGGWVTIYDVGEIGEYTESYNGSWTYGDGMLHLSLVPVKEDGFLVDDSFPVLMLDGELWIGRNENGFGLPHFFLDQLFDILEQPKG